jgi:hypothetical protein
MHRRDQNLPVQRCSQSKNYGMTVTNTGMFSRQNPKYLLIPAFGVIGGECAPRLPHYAPETCLLKRGHWPLTTESLGRQTEERHQHALAPKRNKLKTNIFEKYYKTKCMLVVMTLFTTFLTRHSSYKSQRPAPFQRPCDNKQSTRFAKYFDDDE